MNISDKVSLYAVIPIIFIITIGMVAIFLVSPIEARVSIIASTLTAVTLLFYAEYRADHLGRDRDLLKRYARYGRFVSLYPKNFIPTLSMAQRYLIEYDKVYQKILQEGNRRLGPALFDTVTLFVAIGLQKRSNDDATKVENHRKVLEWAEKTEPGITDKFTNVCNLTLAALTSLRADVETFYVENQLALS